MVTERKQQTRFPVCRMVMLLASVVITLTATFSGLEPFDIFQRVVAGTLFVGVIMFFVNLWFSTLFM